MDADFHTPLASRMRPASIDDFIGQTHLLSAGKPLYQMLNGGRLHSLILWGPPGTGKTSLARMMSEAVAANFATLSAVTSGVADIRKAVDSARESISTGEQTVLFVDEVHRFNKSQQDAFLPHIEDGSITFVGATTENPSFELNKALLSRARVYILRSLGDDELRQLVKRAISDPLRGLGDRQLTVDDKALNMLIAASHGDARRILTMLELAADLVDEGSDSAAAITAEIVSEVTAFRLQQFDKGGDVFYDQISALQKSIRGSDPDAAMYWCQRMIQGGCDPHYLLRRLQVIASEDIGNADPRAITVVLSAWQAFDRLGPGEGDIPIAQAVTYLAVAPKSNAAYLSLKAAKRLAGEYSDLPVPTHLRNAPTALAKSMGHGDGYRYSHDEPGSFSAGQRYFPDELKEEFLYNPTDNGLEKKILEKVRYLREQNKRARDE
ncbi:MAG: replication-associated recombination protein A [Pseudomonadota bacterium]